MKHLFLLAWREARKCLAKKSFVILLVLIPILLNVLFGVVFLPMRTARNIPFAIWDQEGSKDSRQLVRFMQSNPAFDVRYFLTDAEEGKKLLVQRKIRGFMIIPGDFSKKIKKGKPTDLIVYEDFTFLLPGRTLMKNLYKIESWYQNDLLKDYFRGKGIMDSGSRFLANPAVINFRPLFNQSLEYTQFMLPGVLFTVLFQMLLLLGVTAFFMNREVYAGCSKYSFLGVKSFVMLLFSLVPFAITYGIFFPVFGLQQGNFFLMTGIYLLFSLACIWMGMALAVISRDQILATALVVIFGAIGFTFSGYTWPRFLFPGIFKKIVYILPITSFLEEGSKLFFGTGFPLNPWKLAILGLCYLLLTMGFLEGTAFKGGRQ